MMMMMMIGQLTLVVVSIIVDDRELHLIFNFPTRYYLFMNKASSHYKSKKVQKYFEENKNTPIPAYLPTASPEFMVLEMHRIPLFYLVLSQE
jgi:hypothetical protein